MVMRKFKIVTLVLWCLLTAGLCGILAYGMSGYGFYAGYQSYEVYGGSPNLVFEKEIPLDGIDNILVQYDMNNNDIYLREGDADVLTIREYNELELKEDEISTVTVTDGRIEVRGKRRNGIEFQIRLGRSGFRSVIGYTEIILPASYKGQLSLMTASGDIKREAALVLEKDFEASTSSGDIMLTDVTAENISLKCSSGDIDADQLIGVTDIESTSGEITVRNFVGGTKLKSSSGDIESESITGNARLVTTSGEITVQHVDGDVSAESSSGDIGIHKGSGARTVMTTSGDIRLDGVDGVWEIQTSSGEVWIKAQEGSGSISTTSGDINLKLSRLAGSLNMDSSSGLVQIGIAADNAFDFRADTSSGDIETFFDDDLSFSKRGNSAHGTYGDSEDGSSVVVKTTSGDVWVSKLN